MVRINQRSKVPQSETGPRVGVIFHKGEATVRVLAEGERSTLPRATIKADDESVSAIQSAAEMVVERIRAHLRQPVPVRVTV